ncbi:MAG: peptidylprolyl isomerase [Bacilli bacterium]|nr:peptidylprolyl isomerase [Bacilli bacterium]
MNKKTLSLSLMVLLGATCLSSCADIKTKKEDGKDVLFSVGGANVYAEDILGFDETTSVYTFLKTDAGKKAVYNAVEKAVVQANYPVTDDIIQSVESSEMADWDEKVKEYVESYGVTARKAEQTLLEEAGFETKDELYDSYVLARQKEKLWEEFEDEVTQPLVTSEANDSLLEEYVSNTAPMIVKHILVKTSDSNVRTKSTITEEQADKLGTVLNRLKVSNSDTTGRNSFVNIASEDSDDSSSKNGGNLGIMDTYTSFVSEFKLGLYVAEAKRYHDAGASKDLEVLGINDEIENRLFGKDGIYANYNIRTVALDTIGDELIEKSDDLAEDKQKEGISKDEYDVQLYPRNQLFNEFLNFPGVSYLKAKATDTDYIKDEMGNPVVMVRSSYGIHFLSVTWSALDHDTVTSAEAKVKDNVQYFMFGNKADVKLEEKYTTAEKYNIGYANASDGEEARESEIEGRVNNYIKAGYGSLSSNASLYDFRVFKYYLAKSNIEIENKTLKAAIEDYMNLTIDYTKDNIALEQEKTWDSYIKKINSSYEMHELYYEGISNSDNNN